MAASRFHLALFAPSRHQDDKANEKANKCGWFTIRMFLGNIMLRDGRSYKLDDRSAQYVKDIGEKDLVDVHITNFRTSLSNATADIDAVRPFKDAASGLLTAPEQSLRITSIANKSSPQFHYLWLGRQDDDGVPFQRAHYEEPTDDRSWFDVDALDRYGIGVKRYTVYNQCIEQRHVEIVNLQPSVSTLVFACDTLWKVSLQ